MQIFQQKKFYLYAMEFCKLYNFAKNGVEDVETQLLVIHERGVTDVHPDLIIIETVEVDGRRWEIHLPYYDVKDHCRLYFEGFDETDAVFWRQFIRRQITTPVPLNKITFLITDANDGFYLPYFLDGYEQEYDVEEVFGDVSDGPTVAGVEVKWQDDGCWWKVKELEEGDIKRDLEKFELKIDGKIVDQFNLDHTARRTSDLIFATLQIEIQKIAYVMAEGTQEQLDSM